MKKAVITTGGKQYLVSEGQELNVELLEHKDNKVTFEALLVIDNGNSKVGKPVLTDHKVTAEVLEQVKTDKVTAIRYKAKKRVHKVHGHRQQQAKVKINKIS